MKDKYYTPTIEEFHVGFEYEAFIKGGATVLPKTFPDYPRAGISYGRYEGNPLGIIEHLINGDRIRVKYLDQEDIESFGIHKKELTKSNSIFENKEVRIGLSYIKGMPYVIISKAGMSAYDNVVFLPTFRGAIKNKSELGRILKQIGWETK
tara:strand:- start:954 stop:1406 length:453 start_codon:yes stop_codon:yes gene_type:complete